MFSECKQNKVLYKSMGYALVVSGCRLITDLQRLNLTQALKIINTDLKMAL